MTTTPKNSHLELKLVIIIVILLVSTGVILGLYFGGYFDNSPPPPAPPPAPPPPREGTYSPSDPNDNSHKHFDPGEDGDPSAGMNCSELLDDGEIWKAPECCTNKIDGTTGKTWKQLCDENR